MASAEAIAASRLWCSRRQPCSPLDLSRPVQVRVDDAEELQEVLRVTELERVGLVVFREAFLRVLADRFQQPVSVSGPASARTSERATKLASNSRTSSASIGSPRTPLPRPRACNRPRTGIGGPAAVARAGSTGRRTSRSWRGAFDGVRAATRSPPFSSRNRWSRRRPSSAGFIAGIRAAASSIANGTPSSRVHTATTSRPVAGIDDEVGLDLPGPIGEQTDRVILPGAFDARTVVWAVPAVEPRGVALPRC